jgi:hypothetical protein
MDAMRSGTPSVTTNIGAESMHGDFLWGGLIENNAQDIAAAAIKLYCDQTLWQTSQQQGTIILQKYFGAINHLQSLIDRLKILHANVAAERRQNFIGAMLRHHSLKSTQYMSQWIEAKNRDR